MQYTSIIISYTIIYYTTRIAVSSATRPCWEDSHCRSLRSAPAGRNVDQLSALPLRYYLGSVICYHTGRCDSAQHWCHWCHPCGLDMPGLWMWPRLANQENGPKRKTHLSPRSPFSKEEDDHVPRRLRQLLPQKTQQSRFEPAMFPNFGLWLPTLGILQLCLTGPPTYSMCLQTDQSLGRVNKPMGGLWDMPELCALIDLLQLHVSFPAEKGPSLRWAVLALIEKI